MTGSATSPRASAITVAARFFHTLSVRAGAPRPLDEGVEGHAILEAHAPQAQRHARRLVAARMADHHGVGLDAAVIGGEVGMAPMKTICRMINWGKGSFRLDAYDENLVFNDTFNEATESILIEAMRQTDEVRRLMPELPPLDANLQLCIPMTPKLSELDASELETLQLVINFGRVKSVIDKTPETDHKAIHNLHKLLREGYVEVD